jgi:hypothetical protein
MYEKRKKRKIKKKNPKIYLEQDSEQSIQGTDNDAVENEDNDDNESGFEVRGVYLLNNYFLDAQLYYKDNLPTEEDTSGVDGEDTQSEDDTDNDTNDGSIPRIIYDNSESEQGLY